MMGSFLSRALLMVFGYAYPAYQCFKAVENKNKNEPETQHLLFWCQYWILVAMFSVAERLGDAFFSWLLMYSEAKLAFLIYLWYHKTKGTAYVYNSWVRPFLVKHEMEIDGKLLELHVKASEIGLLTWRKAEGYGLARFSEIIHYFSSLSSSSQAHSDQPASNGGTNQKQSGDFLQDSWKKNHHEQAQHAAAAAAGQFNTTADQCDTEATGLETVMPPESRNLNSSKQETVSKKISRQKRRKWRIFPVSSN